MAPNLLGSTNMFLAEATISHEEQKSRKAEEKPALQIQSSSSPASKKPEYKWGIVWRNVFAFLYLHLGTLYGFYLILFQAKLLTVIFGKQKIIKFRAPHIVKKCFLQVLEDVFNSNCAFHPSIVLFMGRSGECLPRISPKLNFNEQSRLFM